MTIEQKYIHVELTSEVILEISKDFENGSCIPELMKRYGWCRNKITKVLRKHLGERYRSIAKNISQQRRIDGSRKSNNLRKGYKQSPEWIEKRTRKLRGRKLTPEQSAKRSKLAKGRPFYKTIESLKLGSEKSRLTKIRTGVYKRHSVIMAQLHASGTIFQKSHRYGIKSYYESSKTGIVERCDSNFERSKMKQLDNDDSVITWTKKHGIVIEYTQLSGDIHRYVPDFLISYVDGTKLIEELKGRNYDPEINELKFKALLTYCQNNGLVAKWTWQNNKDQF